MTDITTLLAARINAEHAAAHGAARTAIEHAITCGQLLLEAKAEVGHGVWLPWIEQHLHFGSRQAQKYIRLAKHAHELPNANSGAHLSINGALEVLAEPRDSQDNPHFRTSFSGEYEWYTPLEYLDMARQVLGEIDLDPASSEAAQGRVKAVRYFTLDDNGLAQAWGGRVWLNPPYAQPAIAYFADKIVAEVKVGRVSEAIMLTHNYTDTGWFHVAERACAAICFTRGRIHFELGNGSAGAPPQGQAFFYYGPNIEGFRDVFGQIGFVR